MEDLLTRCHICGRLLVENSPYPMSFSRSCPDDGEFFVQKYTGVKFGVIFRPYKSKPHAFPARNNACTIRCNETRQVFYSVNHAAKTMGLDRADIGKHLNKERPHVQSFTFTRIGYTIRVRGGYRDSSIATFPKKPLRCIQTGEVFESINEAAKVLGVDRANISNQLVGRRKTAGGYTFTYITG